MPTAQFSLAASIAPGTAMCQETGIVVPVHDAGHRAGYASSEREKRSRLNITGTTWTNT
jgi:hypothetical protein